MRRFTFVTFLALTGVTAAWPAARAQSSPAEVPTGAGDAAELVESDDPTLGPSADSDTGADAAALRTLFNRVNQQRRRGDYLDGLAGAREGLNRARLLGDTRRQIDFLYLLGRLYWNLSDFPRSIETHLEELKLAQTVNQPALLARTHSGLGLTYSRYDRPTEALHHLELGLALATTAGDGRMRAVLLNSLGNHYLGLNDFARAVPLYEEALTLRQGFGNRRAIAETQTNLGLAADGRGDTATALAYLGRALETFEALKYRRYIANTHRRIASVLRKAGRTDEALAHLAIALPIVEQLASAEVLAAVHEQLALTHEARGNLAEALAAQRRLADVTEAMRNEQDRRRLDELSAHYREEQRELEIALLKRGQELQAAELERGRSHRVALAAGLVGGVGVLGAIVALQLVRLRAERRLRTANERARSQAESAERLKSRLLQMASHDLKVPLHALNATATLIGQAPGADESVRRLAANIQADTARMRGLVRDFLDASAIEEGTLQLHTEVHDLVQLAASALESLRPAAMQKNQTLELLAPAHPVARVRADADRLRQVFDNLVGNALKFTPAGGLVTVGFGETGPWVYSEIRDTGPGLGPAEFAKIFAPPGAAVGRPPGTAGESSGLGLVIARELLALQGGRLEVESRPGAGAVFRVLLPAVRVA